MNQVDVSALRTTLRVELYRLVDEMLDRTFSVDKGAPVERSAEPEAKHPPEPLWMGVGAFAKARGYSPRTVSRYCEQGMPHVGYGKLRRINVAKADEWLAKGGSTGIARAAGVVAGAADASARAAGGAP